MSKSEIIPLRCPSCGSADTVGARELRFGFHFTCKHCATPSVLIVGRELYIPKPDEHVCSSCGRVAPSSARFCQCGQAMVHRCTSRWCGTEIPIDHEICSWCGWPRSLAWDTPEGKQREIKSALAKLADRQPISTWHVTRVAPPEIGIPAIVAFADQRLAEGRADYYDETYGHLQHGYGEAAYPALVNRVRSRPTCNGVRYLSSYGQHALPAIISFLEAGDFRVDAAQAAASLGPKASPAIPALIKLLQTESFAKAATDALRAIGPAVIPHLKPFIGLFKDATMKERAQAIINSFNDRNG